MKNNQENPGTGLSTRGYCKEAVDVLPVGDAFPDPLSFPERGEHDHRVHWVPSTWGCSSQRPICHLSIQEGMMGEGSRWGRKRLTALVQGQVETRCPSSVLLVWFKEKQRGAGNCVAGPLPVQSG